MGLITTADPEAAVGSVNLKTKTKTGWVYTFFYRGSGETIAADEFGPAFVDGMDDQAETWFVPDSVD
jgi:hypothetical protein